MIAMTLIIVMHSIMLNAAPTIQIVSAGRVRITPLECDSKHTIATVTLIVQVFS